MLIDTHAHLWFEDFKVDLEQVLQRARSARVEKIIVPGTNLETSRKANELAKRYPGYLHSAVGVHPEEIQDPYPTKSDLEGAIAIGEIGMDKYGENARTIAQQKILFKKQCELALENDLPVIIHTRQSLAETLEVLDALPMMPRGVFHCFSHDATGLEEALARGFYVSFCANISWSKRVAKLVSQAPSKRLLLETDSPFMKPGGRNEPANVKIMAQTIADWRGITLEELGEQTTKNAKELFRI